MKIKKIVCIIIVLTLCLQNSFISYSVSEMDLTTKDTGTHYFEPESEDVLFNSLDISAIYSYDENKNVNKVISGDTEYSFYYDENSNVKSAYIGDELFANYSYSDTAQVESIIFANGQIVDKLKDEKGRSTEVLYNNEKVFEYDYTNGGEIGVENDYTSLRKTITDDVFEVKSMKNEEQLFLINEILPNTHTFTIRSQDSVMRSISETDSKIDVNFYSGNESLCEISDIYDEYGRISEIKVDGEGISIITKYKYLNSTSDYVQEYNTVIQGEFGEKEHTWLYEYDDNGNVIKESYFNEDNSGVEKKYVYDELEQLVEVLNDEDYVKIIYDKHGNIINKEKLNKNNSINTTYAYSDGNWQDKLTEYNEQKIIYDKIGNPISYQAGDYTWTAGRYLSSYNNSNTDISVSYSYDEIGHRTQKIINESDLKVNYEYFWLGDVLIAMTVSGLVEDKIDTIYFLYDLKGEVYGFVKNGVDIYLYGKSESGDIINIYNTDGMVAEYSYNEFGEIVFLYEEDSLIKYYNPFYYRSYCYDRETEMYYLLSRYYMPDWGRFLNADAYFSTGSEINSTNMFAYCFNNPVNMSDPYGYWGKEHHRDWTKDIALEGGNTSEVADEIGQGSYSVDIDMSTNPLRAPIKWRYNQRYHFDRRNYCDNVSGGEDTRTFYAGIYIEDALAERNSGNYAEAADLIGKALHFLQDCSAHGNVGLNDSIAAHGDGFDDPTYDWVNDDTRISVTQVAPTTNIEGCPQGYGHRYEEFILITALTIALYNM